MVSGLCQILTEALINHEPMSENPDGSNIEIRTHSFKGLLNGHFLRTHKTAYNCSYGDCEVNVIRSDIFT